MKVKAREDTKPVSTHQHLHAVVGEEAFLAACSKLTDQGQRLTKPRKEILRILAGTHQHLRADEIVDQLHQLGQRIHRATVYRTLESLEEMQMLRVSKDVSGASTYHLAMLPGAGGHVHMHCSKCSSVEAFDTSIFLQLQTLVLSQTGFLIESHSSDLVGLCKQCQEESYGCR